MEKTFATDDHSQLIEAAGGRAFQFFERSDRMTKSASDAISKKDMQEFMPPDSHFGVHLITMGEEETFGANRNGDSASSNSLGTYHPTFEKFGCVFREHKNKCQKTQGVGQVKLARMNPRMHRGELIVWVDKDKAPDMYKAAKADEELSWSMSMKLPHDECSCCKRKSKRTTDYCSHLKSAMLKYVPEFKKFAYARNEDDVKFFDISEVKRRADRIATYLGYSFNDKDGMAKAAAEAGDLIITGAEWARFHGHVSPAAFTPWEELTLQKLAAAANFVRHADIETQRVLFAGMPQTLTHAQVETLAGPDFRSVGGELAKRAMILDFPSFASLVTGQSVTELRKLAEFRDIEGFKIPELIENMQDNGGCECGEEAAEAVAPDECGTSFSPGKDAIDDLIDDVGDNLGLKPQKVTERALTITIKMAAFTPVPAVKPIFDPYYSTMAEAYGHYLVKAAHIAKDAPGVSENVLLRSVAAALIFGSQKGCHASTGAA